MIPESTRTVIAGKLTRYQTLFFTSVGLLLVLIMSARSPIDTDMWWHLRAGEWMVENGQVLLHDEFSFTKLGEPWVNHSWLAEIILYILYRIGGTFGLALFTSILATGGMGFLIAKFEGHPLYKAFLAVLLTPVAAMVWSPRPQMFSWLFLAITVFLLYEYQYRRTRKIWLLVPVILVWSNLHGGYVLGLLMAGAFIAGALLDHSMGWGKQALTFAEIRKLAIWTIAGWGAAAINPNGINAWLIPFKTVGVSSLRDLISEWASPDFHDPAQWPFLIILLLIIFAVGYSGKRLSGFEFMSAAIFTGMALISRRNFGPFTLAAGPVLAAHLRPILLRWWEHVGTTKFGMRFRDQISTKPGWASEHHPARFQKWVNGVIVFTLLAAAILKLAAVSSPEFLEGVEPEFYPSGAVQWIIDEQPAGNMLSSYGWGGYLLWRLRDYPVFIDGRTDLYDDAIIQEWLTVIQAGDGWQDVLRRWNIDLVLVEPDRPIVATLQKNGWIEFYRDQTAVLLSQQALVQNLH